MNQKLSDRMNSIRSWMNVEHIKQIAKQSSKQQKLTAGGTIGVVSFSSDPLCGAGTDNSCTDGYQIRGPNRNCENGKSRK